MKNREYIYDAIKIIEKNLKSDINVYSVSERFGFSHYYFSRIFKGVTGYNLKEYILKRKISESYWDIKRTDKRLIDIALEYGFSSNESFSRAFKKTIGMNPSLVRKQSEPLACELVRPLTIDKINSYERNIQQEPEEVELDKIFLVGMPFYFDVNVHNDLLKPWSELTSNISLIKNRVEPEKYYQVQYWLPDNRMDLIYIFIAAQVKDFEGFPVPFEAKEIPKNSYLKFLHRGPSNKIGITYQYIYDSFLPETDYKFPYHYHFEYFGAAFINPQHEDSVSEIYIPFENS